MTTVVTGANGHVGANLIRALLARGRAVRALVHTNRKAIESLNVDMVRGDVCDLPSLCEAFKDAEVVYHLAARISLSMDEWPLCESINVTGTRNVVEACLRCGVRRLVHFSSIHAFEQEPLDIPLDESRPLVGVRHSPPYDRSKAAGEKEVCNGIERGLDAIIINPTAIIGPNDYEPSYLGEALLNLAHGKLPALVAGGFDWVDVRDVVEGAVRAEEQAPTGAKYLLSGHWTSFPDLAAIVEEVTGVPAPNSVFPLWLARIGAPFTAAFAQLTGKRPLYTSVSIRALCSNQNVSHERAAHDFGYNPRPLRETVVDTFRWFEENGYLGCPVIPQSAERL
ncbi:MAG: NAD-dependent epimerase/dehydratase family protein [Dehalococcoidia bacterium]|nr:NAD-dependent epimerase/dehydratase family protein [Dehalococcoidia bacterium]